MRLHLRSALGSLTVAEMTRRPLDELGDILPLGGLRVDNIYHASWASAGDTPYTMLVAAPSPRSPLGPRIALRGTRPRKQGMKTGLFAPRQLSAPAPDPVSPWAPRPPLPYVFCMSPSQQLLPVGPLIRKLIWRLWYPFVTRRLRGEEVLFLNYGFEEESPERIPLRAEDEPDRAWIQLYHHVATQVSLRGKSVLEVSCGHGGGAAYVVRTFGSQRYTGVDLNPAAIQFCRLRHPMQGLFFEPGDSEKLPFEANEFDAVLNVEASHCYPRFARFLAEVTRVLRPGGHLLYADFRSQEDIVEWEQAFASSPLQVRQMREINEQVRRGIDRNSARSLDLIQRHLPKFLESLGRDFAGLEGSKIYRGLTSGGLSYRSYCLEKPRGVPG